MMRTHYCGALNRNNIGQDVTLSGWVHRRRDLGGLIFIDMRDRDGIVQVCFDPKYQDALTAAAGLRNEFCIQIKGEVIARPENQINKNMATGEVEVLAKELRVYNASDVLPLDFNQNNTEEQRLKYRYLDLRRPEMAQRLKTRAKITSFVRRFMDDNGFLDIETPMLTKATPEGARDYLVPSRVHKGKFYALPQSPQLFKQLLMMSGFDRYYQIVKCFRDEDLRADRQPEFTQIDIEMSFGDEDTIFAVVEDLMQNIFKETKNYTLEDHFVRVPWAECMRRFGTDKPDMRFGNEIQDITAVFENTEFQVFKNTIENGGIINCVKFENAADKYSRKGLDQLQDFVKHGFKAKALAYLKMENDVLTGSIAKVLSEEEKAKLVEKLGLVNNDLVLVIADSARIVQSSLGALRVRLGHELNLIPSKATYKFLWVTDFPMFEYSEEDERWVAAHHPFTAPKEEDVDKLFADPGHVSSRAYDLVLNGYELLSGSIRIHSQELQAKVFEAIGLSLEDAKARFGFFLDSFRYGTPPHGGVGIGLERLIMVLAGTDNIRDVVAFPTTNSSFDLMSEAPNVVDKKQLDILGIEISKQEK